MTNINEFKTRKHTEVNKDTLLKVGGIVAAFFVFITLWLGIIFSFFLLLPVLWFRNYIMDYIVSQNLIDIDVKELDDSSQINEYTVRLKTDDGQLRLNNPFSGIMVIGGAGSGKSASLAKPLLQQFS